MRRLGFVTALVLLAGLVSAVVALASTSPRLQPPRRLAYPRVGSHPAESRSHTPESRSQIELARNKAAARADAKHLVALVKLPAGSVKSETEPKGDHRLLKPMRILETVLTHRLAHAWYVVPAGAADPYSYVKQHPPGGVKSAGTMGSAGPSGSSTTLLYDFPDKHRVFARMLEVTFTTLKDGDTGVLIAAQSNWIIPRPSSERVPATAIQVVISTAKSTDRGGAEKGSGTAYPSITSKGEVRKLIKIVDAPPIVQDMVSSGCPESTGTQHAVTLKFADANGKTLAAASVSWIGNETVGDWCNPISFKLGKKSQPDLVDTHFLAQVGRVTGQKLR